MPGTVPTRWTLITINLYRNNALSVFRCWDLIDSHTTQVIRSESFLHLSHAQLGDIVRRSTLCVEEIDLYERVVQWARTQLER